MEYDKKPNVIKYQGSKLQVMQQLTDQLASKMGKSHLITWTTKNLENNVSLAEVFNELTTNLDILGEDYIATGCEGTYYGVDKDTNIITKTISICSTNNSSVCTRDCNGYVFKSCTSHKDSDSSVGGCTTYHGSDTKCKADQFPE